MSMKIGKYMLQHDSIEMFRAGFISPDPQRIFSALMSLTAHQPMVN